MSLFSKWFGPKQLEDELNEESAKELGWGPAWFGASGFGDELVESIKEYQKKVGIYATGIVDIDTYRRRLSELQNTNSKIERDLGKFIICSGEKVPIKWNKVITHENEEGLEFPQTHFRPVINFRNPRMFIVHWDVLLSSHATYNVLMKRGISVQFGIDNDGTIHQWMDAEDIAWHAGSRIVNNRSIGVEISNAYYLKYQEHYENKGFGSRPIWRNKQVHGKTLEPFLGFYDVQIRALEALIEAVHFAYPTISLQVPKERNGQMSLGVHSEVKKGRFSGIVNHYHVTERKIDCAGLDLEQIVENVKNKKDALINENNRQRIATNS